MASYDNFHMNPEYFEELERQLNVSGSILAFFGDRNHDQRYQVNLRIDQDDEFTESYVAYIREEAKHTNKSIGYYILEKMDAEGYTNYEGYAVIGFDDLSEAWDFAKSKGIPVLEDTKRNEVVEI